MPSYAEIAFEYNDGASLTSLAKKHGIPQTTLRRNIIAAGAQMRDPGYRQGKEPRDLDKQIMRAITLYKDEELSINEILRETGIAVSTLYIYLKKHRVALREKRYKEC